MDVRLCYEVMNITINVQLYTPQSPWWTTVSEFVKSLGLYR